MTRFLLYVFPALSITACALRFARHPRRLAFMLGMPVLYSLTAVRRAGEIGAWRWERPLTDAMLANVGVAAFAFAVVGRRTWAMPIVFTAAGITWDLLGRRAGLFRVYRNTHPLVYGVPYFGLLGSTYALSTAAFDHSGAFGWAEWPGAIFTAWLDLRTWD